MNETAKQYYNKDNHPQSTSIISLVKDILKDSDLSIHASNILAQLALASGYKGYCWMLIDTISKNSRLGRTQTKLYLKELVIKKRIKIHHRPGRSSRFEVLDITKESNEVSRTTDHRKEYKNKENVTEKANVIFNFPEKTKPAAHSESESTEQIIETEPPSTPAADNKIIIIKNSIQPSNTEPTRPILHQSTKPIKTYSNVVNMTLVQEILEITNDRKSLNCFIKIVKNCPESIVYAAISSLKSSIEENYILRPGAYFVSTIKSYCPDLFTGQKTAPVTLPTKNNSSVVPLGTSKKQCFEPEDNVIPASPEVAMQAINKIKLILNKNCMA
jgi:hypothetical protein